MEKTLIIDDKEVRFKSTGATPLRYKAQLHRDFFADILRLNSLRNISEGKELKAEDIEQVDFDVLFYIVWVLAKTSDNTIPEPFEWLDKFDEFPIIEIVMELQDLIGASLQSKKKTNHPAVKKTSRRKHS